MEKPLLPTPTLIKSFKSGNKISRYFRHLFERINIKKIFGANIALMVVSSSLVTNNIKPIETIPDNPKVESAVVFKTQHSEIKYPVHTIRITQRFSFFHPGVDLDGVTGDPITPVMNGVVTDVQKSRVGYGYSVMISHGGEIESLYAHLSRINVTTGQQVDTGTVIGLMGATGRAFGDHLHLEIYQSGKRINPLTFLK